MKSKILFFVFLVMTTLTPSVWAENAKLPFVGGSTWECTQGNNENFSHNNKLEYAFDFVPISGNTETIVAMRSGIIKKAYGGATESTYPQGPINFGNYISIKNADGTYDHYAHLAYGSLLVTEDDYVVQGQPIAKVGTTGWSTAVHIHVHRTVLAEIWQQSVPFAFSDVHTDNGKALRGNQYTSNNYLNHSVIKPSNSNKVYLLSNNQL